MRAGVLFCFLASAHSIWAAGEPTSLSRKTHQALFESFLPSRELTGDPKLAQIFTATSDGIWNSASPNPAFQRLLAPFLDLRGFGGACGIADFLKGTEENNFASLAAKDRQRVLSLLESCRENEPRRLAMTVRNFYVGQTYGLLQESLSGVKLNVYASAEYDRQHRPRLPGSRLIYKPAEKEIASVDKPFDYLIVGSGTAGSVLAHELRRGGKNVVLVERGSFVIPGSMETRLVGDLIDTRTSVDGGIWISNGMTVGGGSQVNIDLCFAPTLPSVQAKIDSWRKTGRIGKSDFSREQIASAYDWVKAAIGTRVVAESEINPNNRVLWSGAKLAGLHPKLYDLNTYPPGRSPYPVTDKRSGESELILEALLDAQNPLSLLPDADVRRVLFEDQGGARKAVGVEIRMRAAIQQTGTIPDLNNLHPAPGQLVTLHARHVILSAGALGSPTILLRSGIANDEIGRGIVLHVSMPVMGLFEQTIDALSGTQASVFVDDKLIGDGYAFESMSAVPLYAALMSPGPPMHTFEMVRNYRHLAGFGVMLIDTPSRENRITLDSQGEPLINYALLEADKIRFRRGVAQAVRMMFFAGAKEIYLPTTEDLLRTSNQAGDFSPVVLTRIDQADLIENNLRFIPNRTIVTSAHMQATNKMGLDPKQSVVSTRFRVWGTEELYVMDGSVFPTSIGANPMQSIYTFAKIFADELASSN